MLKKIRYKGKDYRVVRVKEFGGAYSYESQTITVGSKGSPELQQDVLLHEIMEMILMDNYTRYHGEEGAMNPLFVFDHTTFCKVAEDLSGVLRDNKIF